MHCLFEKTDQLGGLSAALEGQPTASSNDENKNDDDDQNGNEDRRASILPPHLVLQIARIGVENEGLLVQVARLLGELVELLATTKHLVCT